MDFCLWIIYYSGWHRRFFECIGTRSVSNQRKRERSERRSEETEAGGCTRGQSSYDAVIVGNNPGPCNIRSQETVDRHSISRCHHRHTFLPRYDVNTNEDLSKDPTARLSIMIDYKRLDRTTVHAHTQTHTDMQTNTRPCTHIQI